MARAASEAPNNALYRLTHGRCLDALGKTDAAIVALSAARSLDPQNRSAALTLAEVLVKGRRAPEAIQVYETLLQAQPNDLEALQSLARLHVAQDEYGKAVPYLRRAAESLPPDLIKQQELGEALFNSGDHAGAVVVLQKVVDSMPRASVSRVWLAESLVAQSKLDEAEKLLRAGAALDANDAARAAGLGDDVGAGRQVQGGGLCLSGLHQARPERPRRPGVVQTCGTDGSPVERAGRSGSRGLAWAARIFPSSSCSRSRCQGSAPP